MAEIYTELNDNDNELIQRYARAEGITDEEAIKRLSHEGILARLNRDRRRAPVRTFRSPKRD